MHRAARGMMLIEIMIVVAIIAMITGAVAVGVIDHFEKAKVKQAQIDLRTISGGLKAYYVREGRYPQSLSVLAESGMLEQLSTDPWGNEYLYELQDGRPKVTSLGKDGEPGGDGDDADLSNR